MANPICELFGIDHPILLGGMLHVGRPRLAASVSEAGGLGILGAGHLKPHQLIAEVQKIRQLTAKPFGVNIPLRIPQHEALIEAALEASVKIFSTSGGTPAEHTARLNKAGAKTIHVVATVRQAVNAQATGVDAVVAEGCESGGILGKDPVTTMALVPQVVDAVSIPVIAAGGIADGRGMAAAFALGAQAVQMGTRFLACEECELPSDYKQALLIAGDTGTWVFRNPSGVGLRSLKTELLQQVLQANAGAVEPLSEDLRKTHHGRAAGQGVGLIREILPAAVIIRGMLGQARQTAVDLTHQLG